MRIGTRIHSFIHSFTTGSRHPKKGGGGGGGIKLHFIYRQEGEEWRAWRA